MKSGAAPPEDSAGAIPAHALRLPDGSVPRKGRVPPRRAAPSDPEGAVAGVVLAAGSSRRMGPANKLVLDVRGEPMVRHVAATAREAGLQPVVVVTGHDADAVAAALEGVDVRLVHNREHEKGMSTSLAAGVDAVPPGCDASVILLGDMPWVRPETIRALRSAFRPDEGVTVCAPVHRGKRGNPVLWAREHFPRMRSLAGDQGARSLLEELADQVAEVEVDDPGVLKDADEPGMLQPEPGDG